MRWNWLQRLRRRRPISFGTVRETADEQRGVRLHVQAYPLHPDLTGPNVNARPLGSTAQPTTIISLDARRHAHAHGGQGRGQEQPDYVAEMHDLAERYWLATENPEGYYDGGDCA